MRQQNKAGILKVISAAMAKRPVAKSPHAANVAKVDGSVPTTPGRMNTSPKKRKLWSVAIARCAATASIALSLGQM
jgi:hypothetical protein